jgi:hypothetical protein
VSLERLKFLRLLIPGVLFFLILPPLFQERIDLTSYLERFSSIKVVSDSMAAILFGALYEILDLRRFAWRRSLRNVNNNIKDRLLAACSEDSTISAAAGWLRKGRTLMNVFYRLVDKDATLREKAKRVYFNGLLWSSVVDVATVGAFGAFVYSIAFRLTDRLDQLIIAVTLGVASVVAYFLLLPQVTDRHLDLSNDQLEIIEQHMRADLCADIRTVVDGR